MSTIVQQIKTLITKGEVLISEHGYDELQNDGIRIRDIINNMEHAVVVEEYPDYHKGKAILVLLCNKDESPIHIVWGIPKGKDSPAVLVTAYKPDIDRWDPSFLKRIK